MHLKTLTLRGFKSFAQATTLRFEPGITCVVGPNGSGKSNVVDALAWVMGEQGAKTLRGGSMADVIFAGTTSRPALGRAEVSLTIDNTDGALPIDYAEVTISRTLFRSGGSEYAINGTACRLLDIQELLSDTGMGRQMHVIVGQGQLDKILHATAEERRGFIEEAAGVLKHRRRKEKALRKLETMAANLVRVEDLTAEIRRQLGPLARQADVARRAGKIQADARDAKSRLYADDYAQLLAKLHAEQADEDAITRQRTKVAASCEQLREQLRAAESRGARLGPQLRAATNVRVELSTLNERLASIAQLASERSRYLNAAPPRFHGPSPKELRAQAEAVAGTESELRDLVDRNEVALNEAISAREHAEANEADAERELANLHRAVADRREGIAKLAGKVAAKRSRIEAATAERSRLEANLQAANSRLEHAEHAYNTLEAEIAANSGDEQSEAAHGEALAAAERAEARAREVREQLHDITSQATGARTRQETLALSLHDASAYGALSEAGHASALLSQVLRVDEPWRAAIAAALDQWADAALTSDPDAALTYITGHELGGIRLLHNPSTTPFTPRIDLPEGASWARTHVRVRDERFAPAINAALSNVVLVASDAQAAALLAAHHDLVTVTRDATVRTTWQLRVGSDQGASQLELRALHDDAAALAARCERTAETLRAELARAEADAEAARHHVAACLDAVRQADAARAQSNQRLAQLGATVRSANDEVQRTGPAIAELNEHLQAYEGELNELIARLRAAEAEP
ncbi:MAG: AAA family ATPase, partial [Bowdeniella nasicola]|nr:AAA family ATPase [Bowdeniella nasicola]